MRLVIIGMLALAGACGGGTPPATDPATAGAEAEPPEVVATVGGEAITVAELREEFGDEFEQLETAYRYRRHQLVSQALDQALRRRLLDAEAGKRGMTVDQLLAAEVESAPEPDDAAVAQWYERNRDRIGPRSLDDVRPQIRAQLQNEARQAVFARLEARLREEHGVEVSLEPFRFRFDNEGAPAAGPASAPVTLVEFSDFQCPYCARFAGTLKELEQRYGSRLRIVFRHFPVASTHPRAHAAAEASMCAHEQGRFWPMHDLLFAETDRLTDDDLLDKARRIRLDTRRFAECREAGRYADHIAKDMREASRVGINGTPTVFVNGIPLPPGAQPLEVVAEAIDAELQRARR